MTRILLNLAVAALTIIPLVTINNQSHLLTLEFVEEAEQIAYDYRLRNSIEASAATGMEAAYEHVKIIDIDQDTMDRHGNWPWRRDQIADFIAELLDLYEVKMVVLPESFAERIDYTSALLTEFRDRFYHDDAVLNALDQMEPEFNFDLRLLNEFDGRPVVLGFEFDQSRRQIGGLPDLTDLYDTEQQPVSRDRVRLSTSQWPTYQGYTSSLDDFLERTTDSGFTNFSIDSDGQIRSYPLMAKFGGDIFRSLSLVSLQRFENPNRPNDLVVDVAGHGRSIERIGIPGVLSNVGFRGEILLNFVGRGGRDGGVFEYYPAHMVLDNSVPVDDLVDKIVFIGSSSEIINDLWSTPVNARMPGIELHALALLNLREQIPLVRPQGAWLVEAVLLVALGLVMAWLYTKLRTVLIIIVSVAGIFATYYVNYTVFWLGSLEVYRVVPFFALFTVMMLWSLVSNLVVEYRAKKKVEGVLNQYIPPELAKEVNKSKKGFSMEGEIREMTILFSDVRGFTSISERLKPHELTELMNRMLTALSQQIHVNRGTIDKYIGDAVMAFWNAPLDDPNHATNAVLGALGMLDAMEKLSEEFTGKGLPEMKMGVGINTGEACVGNMGSEIRLSYTVMGDTVNLASRLEGITKQYGVRMIVGERTYELTQGDFLYRPVDAVQVKGKEQAVLIYEPLCHKAKATPDHYGLQDASHQYWESYKQRHFDDAVTILEELLALYPDDGLVQIYLNRARSFMEAPPPDDWNAVTRFDTK